MSNTRNAVLIEAIDTKTFASMLDWPGWSRSGKTESDALAALSLYADRYRAVIALTDLPRIPARFNVIDRIPGTGATTFGVPDHIHQAEYEPVSLDEAKRLVAILRACREYFDQVSRQVSIELRKGPRGGGRDRDEIIDHVIQADRGYARRIGVRTPPFDSFDHTAVATHHQAVDAALLDRRDGHRENKDWPMRYAVRRMAWHILDHAWEMEDKDLAPATQT
jgi:hypothetical protein